MTSLKSVLLSYKTLYVRYEAAYEVSDWPGIIILTFMAVVATW